MILWLKFLHIATLSIWCAGLLSLPMLYARRPQVAEGRPLFELQAFTRFLFVTLASPAAFLAIGSGTALIFLRETFTLWFAAKLLAVGVLALLHLVNGYVVLHLFDNPRLLWRGTNAGLAGLTLLTVLGILWLVLDKPGAGLDALPEVLHRPGGLRDLVGNLLGGLLTPLQPRGDTMRAIP
ncbi:CopD family protein [Roseomonas mucosa]